MSYKNTILHRPGEKFPFLLATQADGIPLTRQELEALKFECEVALMEDDEWHCANDDETKVDQSEMEEMKRQYDAEQYAFDQADMEPHKRDGYMERLCEMADLRRDEIRENGI